ncbi:MAG: SMC-Scp complex subunit ScpB [Candidatus Vogelbacteria bacterium]|nr:SMC-Scp complex subunit ScpB [Candidatus Vogelbacteria bacterium]
MDDSARIEAVLFLSAEPMPIAELSRILALPAQSVRTALDTLEQRLATSGIRLIEKDGSVVLGTAPSASDLVSALVAEERGRDLPRAGTETLSIICYYGPASKHAIDHIRGVNSSAILRTLLVRGLIERVQSEGGDRSFAYRPSFELLAYLGITKLSELPEYEQTKATLANFFNGDHGEDGK